MAKFIKVTNTNKEDGIARVNPDHIRGYSFESSDGTGTYIVTSTRTGYWVKETPDEIDKLIAETEGEIITGEVFDLENMTFDDAKVLRESGAAKGIETFDITTADDKAKGIERSLKKTEGGTVHEVKSNRLPETGGPISSGAE